MDVSGLIKHRFNSRQLLFGLGIASVIYVLIFSLVGLLGGKSISKMEEQLASDTVFIEAEGRPSHIASPTHDTHNNNIAAHQHTQQTPHAVPSIHAPKGGGLTPAPIDGLYEKGAHGKLLPKISSAGLTPFNAYKKPFVSSGKPLIAIAVADYGLSESAAKLVLEALPPQVSLILSPYANQAESMQKNARAYGHELWLSLPVSLGDDPQIDLGTQALSQAGGLKYNQERYMHALSQASGYAGIAAMMNAGFEQSSSTVVKTLFEDAFSRGLGYFEMSPTDGRSVETIASAKRAPYVRNIKFLESTSLKNLEMVAESRGYAVGIVQPYPNSINSLKIWLDTLEGKGFALAPVSAIADLQSN